MPNPVDVDGYTLAQVALLVLAAVLIGFSKSAISGVASISVAIFAAVLPARQSTGAVLPLLILGDVFAVTAYRRHAQWRTLLRLIPAVVVGIAAGTVFVARVDDTVMRRTIGAVLLLLVSITLGNRWRVRATARRAAPEVVAPEVVAPEIVKPKVATQAATGPAALPPSAPVTVGIDGGAAQDRAAPVRRRAAAAFFGALTGFTTMVANAGGPVMAMYMVAMRMPMLAYLGTSAWLFAVFNLLKVPVSAGLGLLTWHSLRLDLMLAPAMLVGAFAGRRVIRHMDQRRFERIVIAVTVLSSLYLLR